MTRPEWRSPSKRTLQVWVLAGAAGLVGACQNSAVIEDTRATAIVTGTVTSTSGRLPTLTVQATAYAPSCASGSVVGGGSGVASPPGGNYSLNVVSFDPQQAVCLVVYATVTINGQRDSVAGAPVSLMLRDDSGPQDTARVNLVFP